MTERKIAEQVKLNLDLSLNELQRAVNINSGTMNIEGVKEVGHLFQKGLEDLGFETEWVDGAAFERAGHLVATHLAATPASLKILMIGHLDTVFAKEDDFQTFDKLDDNHIAGPGITDMKGGNVIIVSALRALHQLKLLNNINVKVVMTGDEEHSGKPLSLSKAALIDAAMWADVALGFEDGDGSIRTAVIARRSSVNWDLEVTGRSAHSSQIFQPDVGYGAIFEAARILNEFRQQLAGSGDLTFNPGMIVGGTTIEHEAADAAGSAFGKNNVIAQSVKVTGGLRALSASELQDAREVMQKIVENNLSHTSATLTIGEGYPPMAPTVGNRRLLDLYSSVSESLNYGPVTAVNPRNAGAADISFAAAHVDMALDGMGLMGKGGHTKDEVAEIDSLTKNTQKAAVLIYRLSIEDEFNKDN